MIFGIGTDIVQIERIAAILTRTEDRFAEKILGPDELVEFAQRREKGAERAVHYLCNRFAAKEAFSKALGLGMRAPMTWHDIQILNDEQGAPRVVTTGELGSYMVTKKLVSRVSLSDEKDYSVAFVVIEHAA